MALCHAQKHDMQLGRSMVVAFNEEISSADKIGLHLSGDWTAAK